MSEFDLGEVMVSGQGPAAPTEQPAAGPSNSTPRASAHPSRAQSPVRIASPTLSLPRFSMLTTWEYDGQVYATVEEAANAAAPAGIPQNVKDWVNNVVRTFIVRDVTQAYETLRTKMKERHARTVAQLKSVLKQNQELDVTVNRLKQQLAGQSVNAQQREADFDARMAQQENNMRVLHSHLLTLKNAQNTTTTYIQQLEQRLASGQAAPQLGTTQSRSSAPKPPKMPDPPKFSGKGSSLMLEQWIKKVQIWLNYNQVHMDKQRIAQANTLLEGGAADYMEEYNEVLSLDQDPDTWENFVKKLEMGYKTLDPKRTAQAKLDAHCEKRFSTMIDFVEKFWGLAPQSGYSDEDLIVKIREHRPAYVQNIMSNVYIMTPDKMPTKWDQYLDMALRIESEFLQQQNRRKGTSAPVQSLSRPAKDPNAMDTTVRVAHDLSSEQMRWLEGKLCIYCGKHPFRKGVFCKNPDAKYKGKKFQMPALKKGKQDVREVEESTPADDSSLEIRALEEALWTLKAKKVKAEGAVQGSSKGKGKAKASSEETEQDARIINFEELSDFMSPL